MHNTGVTYKLKHSGGDIKAVQGESWTCSGQNNVQVKENLKRMLQEIPTEKYMLKDTYITASFVGVVAMFETGSNKKKKYIASRLYEELQ